MTGKFKTMRIPDFLFQILNIFHVHIKKSAASFASHVVVSLAYMLKAICSTRYFDFENLTGIRQTVQIPVHGCSAYIRMIFDNCIVDFISGSMAL